MVELDAVEQRRFGSLVGEGGGGEGKNEALSFGGRDVTLQEGKAD